MAYHVTPKGDAKLCEAREGKCPFKTDHFETREKAIEAYESLNAESTLQIVAKPVSSNLLKNSTHEVSYSSRAYLRLLNHQDYEQAKELYGKVKDQAVIERVKEMHRASTALVNLQEQLTNAQARVTTAKTAAQHAGYKKHAEAIALKLTEAVDTFDKAEEQINELKASYAKELAIHNNSLGALERLVNSNKPLVRPEGIEGRITALKQAVKKSRASTVKPIQAILKSETSQAIVDAAKAYGKPVYVTYASQLHEARETQSLLEGERIQLERASLIVDNPQVREKVVEELAKTTEQLRRLQPTIQAAERRVELFKDEVRDKGLVERDVVRELNALVKLEARTRV